MTLSTNVVIVEPVNPREVFDFCRSLLARGFAKGDPTWDYTPAGEGRGFSSAHYATTCGQGLAAWLWVFHADDAPLRYRDESYDYEQPTPWWDEHCVRVNVDTAYGYRASRNGAGCSDLHAWFVQELGRWLTGRGVEKWVWNNEFSGEWFGPTDDVRALGDPERGELVES